MRITAGKWRGRSVHTPKGSATRPTSSRVREAIFNICQGMVEGSDILDLFAGSGILSLEAISRGAASALLVENAPSAKRCIMKNLSQFQADNAELLFGDALKQLIKLDQRGDSFDLIYADPPYNRGFGEKIAETIDQLNLLRPGGLLFIEEGKELTLNLNNCTLQNVRPYGRTTLHQITRP